MAYVKQEWHDLPLEDTPISADRLNYMEQGIYDAWEHGGGGNAPIGAIMQYGGSTEPTGWLFCDGSAISRTEYADLFTAIGTTYGSGDGSTTFNLPDLRGKVPVGLKSTDTSFDTLGETGGEKAHTLTYTELPAQIVTGYSADNYKNWATGAWGDYTSHSYATNVVQYSGKGTGDTPHNNLQPYIVTNYIIKALDEPTGEVLSETMPIGSEIDYSGSTVPDGWESVDDPNSYSTTEVKTDKTWIDGKPIYRKVIDIGNLPNATTKAVNSGINNISSVTKLYGIATAGSAVIPIPDPYPGSGTYTTRMTYDTTTNQIIVSSDADRSGYSGYVIIEYTKTS